MPTSNGAPRELVVGPDSGPAPPFPLKLNGKVISGFGRGSKELGIPTANIPLSGLSVGGNDNVESGVYFGWAGLSASKATSADPPNAKSKYKLMAAQVYETMNKLIYGSSSSTTTNTEDKKQQSSEKEDGKGEVYPMVMSIGYNPFYNNTVRSVEVHVMHDFSIDFYDTHMNLIITGMIREEYDYVSKDALIDDIKTDIDVAGRSLGREAYLRYAKDPYLLDFSGKSEVAS